MSMDALQLKIRKMKNPSVIDLTVTPEQLPPALLEGKTFLEAYDRFSTELMEALKEIVPAVRFNFAAFSLQGPAGLMLLNAKLEQAKELGYYVLLDGVESYSVQASAMADKQLALPCDGLIVSSYAGSDSIKPYAQFLKEWNKSVFVVLRTANKSASELQDLMTGSRLVYMAAAEMVSRLGESLVGKCGYSHLAGTGAANAPEVLRTLRSKHDRLFLLVDGYDYTNANAKNCSLAFDRLGHGAAVCAGQSVTAAWQNADGVCYDYVQEAVEAAKRMQKNLLRYVTIL